MSANDKQVGGEHYNKTGEQPDGRVTHGLRKHRLYQTWKHMIDRCYRPEAHNYEWYGGRGIVVCERWMTVNNFIEDMQSSYEEGLLLDRIDNNLGYSKDNCKWATYTEQSRNRRTNVMFNGECASDASIRLGTVQTAVSLRIRRGWSIERAFTASKGAIRG